MIIISVICLLLFRGFLWGVGFQCAPPLYATLHIPPLHCAKP